MRSQCSHKNNFSGLAQAVLQNSSQLTGPIWNELLLIFAQQFVLLCIGLLCKALDDITQGAETCINMLGFLKSDALRCGSSDSFAACEIYKNQSSLHLFYLLAFTIMISVLVNINVKYCVGPTRGVIHLLRGHLSVLHASINYVDCLINGFNWHLYKVFNKDFAVVFLTYIQILAFVWIQ